MDKFVINVQARVYVPDTENDGNYDLKTVVKVLKTVDDIRAAALAETAKLLSAGESIIEFSCQVVT